MKSFLWMITGACAATAGLLIWGPRRSRPAAELAHMLEEAWADHHTVV
jgi:hypothetical protein